MSWNFRPIDGDVYAVIRQLNSIDLATDPGYDDIFNEPNLESSGGSDKTGVVGDRYTEYKIRVQVDEIVDERYLQLMAGKERERRFRLVADYREMLIASLIDANGDSIIRVGASVIQLLRRDNTVVNNYTEQGCHITEVTYEPMINGVKREVVFEVTEKRKGLLT